MAFPVTDPLPVTSTETGDTVGLYRESTGFVYFRNTLDFGVADFDFFYGAPSDRILAGDWNGTGVDTVAVYRPSTGMVYFRMTNTQGFADYELDVGTGYVAALTADLTPSFDPTVDVAPVLDPAGDQSTDELSLLSFTATASDPDSPPDTLVFSLAGAPAGASITAGGVFTWTPTEAQGPGVYAVTVRVLDAIRITEFVCSAHIAI